MRQKDREIEIERDRETDRHRPRERERKSDQLSNKSFPIRQKTKVMRHE